LNTEGDIVGLSMTFPPKPPRLARLIRACPLDPEEMVTVLVLATIVNSCGLTDTMTVTVAEWDVGPLVAVMLTT